MPDPSSTEAFWGAEEPGFHELVLRYLEGALPEADLAVLNADLRENMRKRRVFASQCFQASLMIESLRGRIAEMPASSSAADQAAPKQPGSAGGTKATSRNRYWAIAAMVFIGCLVGSTLLLRRGVHPVPAVVTAAIDARCKDPSLVLQTGGRLPAGRIDLTSGCIAVTLDAGAMVIVEGPADFDVDSPTRLTLTHGRLWARVPTRAVGFSVQTATAVVTDLGTEFGVSVGTDGATVVEVFKGRVQAAPRASTTTNGSPQVLSEGQAATVSANSVVLDPGGAQPQRFVRDLSSNLTSLDVVDLVAGGDGTTHRRNVGIQPVTGQVGLPAASTFVGNGAYHPVPAIPVIDGCFVPDGSRGSVQVDSASDKFSFPATDNKSYGTIGAGGSIPWSYHEIKSTISATLGGIDYSKPGPLFMHSNKGLTINLIAVRRLHPGMILSRFRSIVGSSFPDALAKLSRHPKADAYVLVDGKPRFEKRGLTNANGAIDVDVSLRSEDRFLTLAATDGGDGTNYDWVIFANPCLESGGR